MILHVYEPNNRTAKHVKQKLKGEIVKFTSIVRNFNIPLSKIHRVGKPASSLVSLFTRALIPYVGSTFMIWLSPKGPLSKYQHTGDEGLNI